MTFALCDLNSIYHQHITNMDVSNIKTYKYRSFKSSGSIFPAKSKCIFQTQYASCGKPITPSNHLKTKLSKRCCILPIIPVCIKTGRQYLLQSPCLSVCTWQNVCQLFNHFSSLSELYLNNSRRTQSFSPRTVRITFASSILSYNFSHCQLVGLKSK